MSCPTLFSGTRGEEEAAAGNNDIKSWTVPTWVFSKERKGKKEGGREQRMRKKRNKKCLEMWCGII